jgi:hypothetical protein
LQSAQQSISAIATLPSGDKIQSRRELDLIRPIISQKRPIHEPIS